MNNDYDDDRAGSEDLDAILEISREDYQSRSNPTPGPLRAVDEPSYIRKGTLNGRLTALESEINEIDQEIRRYKELRSDLVRQKDEIEKQLGEVQTTRNGVNGTVDRKGKGKARQVETDYTLSNFEWSHELKTRMKKIFGIDNFRLCQQGVCNANMEGRDIVCVMPTGGGKSLTYQLPALLNPGCTLVVSPLISLITDQILHLKEAGVEAVMLTGGTPKDDLRDINSRLNAMAASKGTAGPEIKLCYVTPEKIARNRAFLSLLERLANAGKLARVVIDEAHCVSQLGHDYRPDYKKLSMLRQLFPRVPILALSATCPNKVLEDLLGILSLKRTVDGNAAPKEGTVYFSAPLYRKNLHYTVLPKPSSSFKVLEEMSDYILKNHKDDSGIVYCLTKKDAESVAKELKEYTRGQIKTGVYHADVPDTQKESLHIRWRKGDIKVVCATIAFGLGIDKGNVRFVLHHSLSKSLDGFYQESGRAGRDGKDADCILYYRPQDATRLSSITFQETQAQQKLHPILRFAQDMHECRKIQFAKYFSVSSDLSMASWTTDDADALARCGHCDNCTRPPQTVDQKDVTVEAWQILKIANAIQRQGGRLTLNGLGDLARGSGGGTFEVAGGRGGKAKAHKSTLDLDDIAGGKVCLSKDDTETLMIELLLSGYLEESFHATSYTVNVYLVPGAQALRLARFSRHDLENNKGPRVVCSFRKVTRKGKTAQQGNKQKSKKLSNKDSEEGSSNGKKASSSLKRKRPVVRETDVETNDSEVFGDDIEDFTNDLQQVDDQESDPEDEDWSFSMRQTPAPAAYFKKKPRKNNGHNNSKSVKESEIVDISD